MNVLEDIFSITRFHAAPLIPYLFGDKENYSIGYVTVSFAQEEYDDRCIIDRIDAMAVRKGDDFTIVETKEPSYPVILNFGAEGVKLYQEKANEYGSLINSGNFDDALALFDKIACLDMKVLYKFLFEEKQ